MSVDWPLVRLSDCASFQEGYVNPTQKKPEYFDGEVKWLRAVDLNNSYVKDTTRTLSKQGFNSAGKSALLFEPGTLAISKSGTIGRVGILQDYMCGNRAVINIKVDENKCNTRFIFYVLIANRPTIENLAIGSVQKNLYTSALGSLEFRMPPKEIQDVIAESLGSLDDKIVLNRQTNQTLEHIAQAIFKSWFVDFEPTRAKIAAKEEWAKRNMSTKAGGSDNNINESQAAATFVERAAMAAISGRAIDSTNDSTTGALAGLDQLNPEQIQQLKTTAALFPDTLVDSELGEIPQGWEVKTLAKMVEIIGGGTPKKSESKFWDGDIPWFSVKDAPADGDVFVIDTDLKITELGLNKSSTKLLPEGVTIISARGTVGRLALVGVPTAMNQSCYGIKGANGIGPYLNYFNLKNAVETLQQNTHGAVFDTITTSTFDTVFCANSGQGLKDVFDELVSNNFEKIKNNLFESKGLVDIRESLLPKLLSGELAQVKKV